MRPLAAGLVLLTFVVAGCAMAPGAGGSIASGPVATAGSTPSDVLTLSLSTTGHVAYPASWLHSAGFPTMGTAMPMGVISSGALGPCDASTCQNYTVGANGVTIEFYFNAARGGPPYSGPTNDFVGGLPAYREDWGPVNAHDADEGHTWILHLASGVLVINASLKGPDLATGRAAVAGVLASVVAP